MPEKLVLDASVLVEYIIADSPYRSIVEKIFSRAKRGELQLYVNSITLAEILYVATRIYGMDGIENPNKDAKIFVAWVESKAKTIDIDADVSVIAGEFRKRLKIALPDCFVIATARQIDGKAVFREIEAEMRDVVNELRKLGVVFLNEMRSC